MDIIIIIIIIILKISSSSKVEKTNNYKITPATLQTPAFTSYECGLMALL